MKTCKKCNITFDINYFYNQKSNKDGKCSICKKCYSEKTKEYRNNNLEYDKNRKREYYLKNREIIIKKSISNSKNRLKSDLLYKLKKNIQRSILGSLSRNNHKKKSTTQDILGCSIKDFKLHLESKFEPWMSWDNYGLYNGELNYGWDIDHIIPTSSAGCETKLIFLNHYTNLQPLCSKVNRDIKRDNL